MSEKLREQNRDFWLNLLEDMSPELHSELVKELLKNPALFRRPTALERAKKATKIFDLKVSYFNYETRTFGASLKAFAHKHAILVGNRKVPRKMEEAAEWKTVPVVYLKSFMSGRGVGKFPASSSSSSSATEKKKSAAVKKHPSCKRKRAVLESSEEESVLSDESVDYSCDVAALDEEEEKKVNASPPKEQKMQEQESVSSATKRPKLIDEVETVRASQSAVHELLQELKDSSDASLIACSRYLQLTNENLAKLRDWQRIINVQLDVCADDRARILQVLKEYLAQESQPGAADSYVPYNLPM